MTKAKAGEILEILVNLDFLPVLEKLGEDDYRIKVVTTDGVPINTLKNFQDNNLVTCQGRVVTIT